MPKHDFSCTTCGATFQQWPSQIGARPFCSKGCYTASQSGIAPPNKGVFTVISKPCERCGAPISGMPSAVNRRRYCGKACASAAMSNDAAAVLARRVKVNAETQCWEWTGSKRGGYGRVKLGGRLQEAHRASYEHHRGKIEDGLCLDHLCRNRGCVNPDHLEPVTNAENIRRGNVGQGPRTEAQKAAASAAMNRRYLDPEFREQQRAKLAEYRANPNRLDALRSSLRDPEYRSAKSADMKRIWAERKASKNADHGDR